MNSTRTAIVVDRAHLFREGLKEMLRSGGITVAGESESFTGLLGGRAAPEGADLLLCGFDALLGSPAVHNTIAVFRQRSSATRIVVIGHRATAAAVAIAAEVGADAFLLADISQDAFERSIDLVLLGQQLFPAPVKSPAPPADAADAEVAPSGRDLTGEYADVALSPRERQIIQCLVSGLSNKAIARELHITEATVKVHVTNLMRKLSVANRTQLAIRAIDRGLQTIHPGGPEALRA